MEQESLPHVPLRQENPDEISEQKFVAFVNQNEFSSAELKKAYAQIWGVEEEDGEVPRELLHEMKRMVEEEKFPANRFMGVVNTLHEIENAVPIYNQFVESLSVTDNEKRMLQSLVHDRRSGSLEIMVNGHLEAEILLKEEEIEGEREYALSLMGILSEYARIAEARKMSLEVLFTE